MSAQDVTDLFSPNASNRYQRIWPLIAAYGVNFQGSWTPEARAVVMTAVHAVAGRISELAARDAALSDRMGEGAFSFGLSFLSGLSDGDSFQAVFGSVNMIRIQRDAGFPAETFGATRNPSRNDIEFYNSAFTRRGGFSEHLVLHELGHLFAGHEGKTNLSWLRFSPKSVTKNRNLVTIAGDLLLVEPVLEQSKKEPSVSWLRWAGTTPD